MRLVLGQSDLGKLRVGVDDAGNRRGADIGPQAEQRILDDDAGVIIGEMGEFRAADHVADRIDAAIRGLELLVHLDAVLGELDAGAIEAQRFDVRFAAGGDEEMRSLDDGGLAVLVEMHGDALHRALDALDPGVGIEHDLRVLEPLHQDARSFRRPRWRGCSRCRRW